jgi:hypothetical protein
MGKNLLDLPAEILEHILLYLSHNKILQLRNCIGFILVQLKKYNIL